MQLNTNNFRIEDLVMMDADVTFEDDYKLKISSKKLKSGKCQVKFSAIVREKKDLYGYVLVDAEQTLRDLVMSIKDKLHMIHRTRDFHNLHLYSIGKSGNEDLNFIIFD